MTQSTLSLPREMIEAAQRDTDGWYRDLDDEVDEILGLKKERNHDHEDD